MADAKKSKDSKKAVKKGGKEGEGDGKDTKQVVVPKEPEFPDGPKTIVVGGWSELKSITEAIAIWAANIPTPGGGGTSAPPPPPTNAEGESTDISHLFDKIAIMEGEYEENLTLSYENLHIRGIGEKEKVIIKGGLKTTCMEGSVTNCTFKGGNGAEIQKGGITFTDCIFADSTKHGVSLHSFVNPIFKTCLIQNQQVAGLYCFPNSRGLLDTCVIDGASPVVEDIIPKGDNRSSKVGVYADNSGTIFKKNVIKNQVTGMYIQNDSSTLLAEKNEIRDIGGTGLHFTKAAKGTFKHNVIQSCSYHGILVDGESSPVLEQTSTICSVVIKKGCQPKLKMNTFSGPIQNENALGSNPRMQFSY